MIPAAQRVQNLPRYVFQELYALRDAARAAGRTVFDLGVGNPDGRPPAYIRRTLIEALENEDENCHRYPSFQGMPELRRAVAQWYDRRFHVHLDPDAEVLPLIGSKEGLYHLMQAYLDPGDTILIPTPCYPAYLGGARLCQALIHEMPLRAENRWLIRFDEIPGEVAKAAKMLLINYPNNPTGAICSLNHYRDAIAFCRDHDILLVSDIAYSELSLTDDHVPASIFELPGAREQAVEFQSLSKSHSMAGWRVGFCVGSSEVVSTLLKLKSNVDFGLFMGIQKAAVAALTGDDGVVIANRKLYRRRRDRVCAGLERLGWSVEVPPATMYVWTRLPERFGEDDWSFVKTLFERTGILLTPGSSFGQHGRGYVRISLILDEAGIDACLALIEQSKILTE